METSPNNFQVPKHRRNPHLCKAYVRKILGPPRTSLVNLKPLVVSQLQQPAVKAYVQPMGARCRNLLGCFPKVLLGDTETMRLTWPAVSRGEKTATRYFLLYIIRLLFIWAVSICLYIYIYIQQLIPTLSETSRWENLSQRSDHNLYPTVWPQFQPFRCICLLGRFGE